ncbi:hypothetical protein HaLaN_23550 [Haematococcus lacustris]|uniref:Uncharacterized protein n=1 Tax=Haematococcus lacustris TaxID=44745 RepID=A0A699ZUD3_HAELA|nr:hypothetical protein HaLaN_23550 [Haematococcus lacustris]
MGPGVHKGPAGGSRRHQVQAQQLYWHGQELQELQQLRATAGQLGQVCSQGQINVIPLPSSWGWEEAVRRLVAARKLLGLDLQTWRCQELHPVARVRQEQQAQQQGQQVQQGRQGQQGQQGRKGQQALGSGLQHSAHQACGLT